jgi:hypothetical protein
MLIDYIRWEKSFFFCFGHWHCLDGVSVLANIWRSLSLDLPQNRNKFPQSSHAEHQVENWCVKPRAKLGFDVLPPSGQS